jgi:hypothetical protein
MMNSILRKKRTSPCYWFAAPIKSPKIGCSVFGRQKLWREWIECHNKLMRMYFNDINVLQQSPLMTRIALREGPLVEFEANGHKYNYDYLSTTPTQGGKHLWSRFINRKVRKKTNFTIHKWRLGDMWRKHIRFYKPNLFLWEDWLDLGTKSAFGISWMLVSLCHHA